MQYVDLGLNSLPNSSVNIVQSFINHLSEEKSSVLLYRGENMDDIAYRLGVRVGSPSLFERLFLIGEKSRYFWSDTRNANRDYLIEINDVSEPTFEFIYDKISEIVQGDRLGELVFKNCPNSFREFFSGVADRKRDFLETVLRQNESHRHRLRDYYLFFLHTAGRSGIVNESYFVSTSTSLSVAKKFSKGVVFHYFVPRPLWKYAISSYLCGSYAKAVDRLNLPRYGAKGLFPSQKEVAIKWALFPQFLIGVEDLKRDFFVVNPWLVAGSSCDFESLSEYGFNVDQNDFEAIIIGAKYKKYGVVQDEYIEEHNVGV